MAMGRVKEHEGPKTRGPAPQVYTRRMEQSAANPGKPSKARIAVAVIFSLLGFGFLILASRGTFLSAESAPFYFATIYTVTGLLSIARARESSRKNEALLTIPGILFALSSIPAHESVKRARLEALSRPGVEALVGKAAPPIELALARRMSAEQEATLRSLKGRWILLDFWATWCSVCAATAPDIQALADSYGEGALSVVGVTAFYKGAADRDAETREIDAFCADHGMRYPIVVLERDDLFDRYFVKAFPTIVLIDPTGTVTSYGIGPTGIRAAARKLESSLVSR